MSTSPLYHAFGICGHQYVKTRYRGGEILFTVHQDQTELRCPTCGSKDIIRRGSVGGHFRALPIGKKKAWISLSVQRVLCLSCHLVRQVNLNFADKRRSYTRIF